MLSIECDMPSLKLAKEILPDTSFKKECIIYLEQLDEHRIDVATTNEAHKKCVKSKYGKYVFHQVFLEGDMVLVYDQDKDTLGAWKFNPMWHQPYIVKRFLCKGAYDSVDYEGKILDEPYNRLYLKHYYA